MTSPPGAPSTEPAPYRAIAAGIGLLAFLALLVTWLRAPISRGGAPDREPARDSTVQERAIQRHSQNSLELAGAPLRAGSPGMSSPAPLGPAGAPVSLVGRVTGISAGRTLIECQDRHYMVVRGLRTEGRQPGSAIHVEGKVLGISEDGVFYIEASNP